MKTCEACNGWFASLDKAHIKSKGSGGSMDPLNILHLCRWCHRTQHQIGWKKFSERYPSVLEMLDERGFYFDQYNKLRRDV